MADSIRREDIAQTWLRNNPEMIYDPASNTIYCSKCESTINAKKSNFDRHIKSKKHQGVQSAGTDFFLDLINFLIMCNIPWSQVENPAFKLFFEKYICNCKQVRTIPSESILRKKYLDHVYKDKMKKIYQDLDNCPVWISLDETTDFMGRNVVHFLIKPLNEVVSKPIYMLACQTLDSVNGQSISQFVIECLKKIWGELFDSKVNNVLIMCTDSVAYMLLAGRILKETFPNLKHFTCLAHALHRLTEKIRLDFGDVDTLISNVKKVFLKSPKRVNILREKYPNLPLPPQPVITRWGTWLEAAFYYARYFNEISDVISSLNSNEAISIRNAKTVLTKPNLKNELDYILEYFKAIQEAIKKLEKQNLSITQSFEIFDHVRAVIQSTSKNELINKLEKLMDRNPDFDVIRDICENNTEVSDANLYKFAPLTSVDVERTFSTYKWVLNVKRNRLKIENMEKIMIIYCNSKSEMSTSTSELVDLDDDNASASSSRQPDTGTLTSSNVMAIDSDN